MAYINLTQRPFLSWKPRAAANDRAAGWTALMISVVATSTFNGYAKQLAIGLSALSLLFVSEVLTLFFVLFTFGVFPVIRHLRRLQRRDVLWIVLVGVLNGIGGPFLLFWGLHYTTAVNAGFFENLQMVFTVILAAMLLRERLETAHYAAVLTISIGTVIIALRGFSDGITLQVGDALVIGSCVGFALGSVYYRKQLSHVEPHLALFARSMTSIVIFFAVSPFLPHTFLSEMRAFPVALIAALLGFGFISRFLSSVTYYASIQKMDLTTVSLVGSLSIVGSVAFAHYYLGEPLEWYHYAGGALIVLGTLLLEFVGARRGSQHLEMRLKQKVH